MGLVYLPPFLADFYGFHVGKYTMFPWILCDTPPKFNMEPENNGFQMDFPFPGTYFQVPC